MFHDDIVIFVGSLETVLEFVPFPVRFFSHHAFFIKVYIKILNLLCI